jgi:hypothetical protein
MTRKFYRTEIKLIVISEDFPVGNQQLGLIATEIKVGDWCGEKLVVSEQELTPSEVVGALEEIRSGPDFFGLDNEGNDMEED